MDSVNIASITRVAVTATTGNSGNIYTPYTNDGTTAIVAPCANAQSVYIRQWLNNNNDWMLTVIDPNTGATRNNDTFDIRYWVVKFKRS